MALIHIPSQTDYRQAWGRLEMDDYDYDFDYKQFTKGDYNYDYTKLEKDDYDYDYSAITVSRLRLYITYHDYDYNHDCTYSVVIIIMIR